METRPNYPHGRIPLVAKSPQFGELASCSRLFFVILLACGSAGDELDRCEVEPSRDAFDGSLAVLGETSISV